MCVSQSQMSKTESTETGQQSPESEIKEKSSASNSSFLLAPEDKFEPFTASVTILTLQLQVQHTVRMTAC